MFQRRQKRNRLQTAKEAIWPTIGWLRAGTYWGLRIIRLRGTPHSIALGLACGGAVAMTPFVGLHFVMALLVCWATGGQSLAGIIGTFVGNPWTFPFIWVFTYRLGCVMLRIHGGLEDHIHLSLHNFLDAPFRTLAPMVGPMIVGSIPTAIIAGWIIYIPARRIIAAHQHRRAERLKARRNHKENHSLADGSLHG